MRQPSETLRASLPNEKINTVHVTKPPFFQRKGVREFKVHSGTGVATSMAHAFKDTLDMEIYPSLSRRRTPSWRYKSFDKICVPELGIDSEKPITHIILERFLPQESYHDFQQIVQVFWWIHQSMPEKLKVDFELGEKTGQVLNKNLLSYQEVGDSIARKIIEMYRDAENVIVHDPFFFPQIAAALRRSDFDGRVIGINHALFPKPEEFSSLQGLGFENWKEVAQDYIRGWQSFDKLSFHTAKDANNFKESVRYFLGENVPMPECIVNPLGIDNKQVQHIAENAITQEKVALLESVVQFASNLSSMDSLAGKTLIFDLGARGDPIKRIPLKLKAIKELLLKHPELIGEVIYIQQVLQHRMEFPSHAQEYDEIMNIAQSINKKFGRSGYQPIVIVDKSFQNDDLIKFDRAISETARTPVIFSFGNLAPHEALIASISNSRLVVGEDTALASILPKDSFIMNEHASAEDIALLLYRAISMQELDAQDLYNKMVIASETINVEAWATRLIAVFQAES